MMIFVNTTLDTSISRDKMRSRTGGADAVTTMWSEVQNNIGAFQRMFGNNKFIIVDNTEGKDFKKEYENLFEGMPFMRIHNSNLINLHHVRKYMKGEGGYVIMSDNTEVEVSRRRKADLMEAIAKV